MKRNGGGGHIIVRSSDGYHSGYPVLEENPKFFGASPWLWAALAGSLGLMVFAYLNSVTKMVADMMKQSERVKYICKLAAERGIPAAVSLAIFTIESGGSAFGKDGRMIIRYEPHIFRKYSGGKEVPAIRKGQAGEWQAFEAACAVDKEAALKSISMGLAQIMGFNHKMIGYESPQAMFDALSKSEEAQVRSFFDFVDKRGLKEAAQKGEWTKFAVKYNGAGQKGYDTKMAAAHEKFKAQGFEGIA